MSREKSVNTLMKLYISMTFEFLWTLKEGCWKRDKKSFDREDHNEFR